MYGCNNFCSYCIVPYTRGRERSRHPDAVLEEAKRLVDNGAKEITLLGQNVNSYGNDSDFDCTFSELVHRICSIDGDFRVRFMTSHPKDVTDELICAFSEEEKMIKHFHLPLQSGSDSILKRMNRHYSLEHYMSVVDKLKAKCPDVSLTSDIIVAFPGETDEDFEMTMDALRRVRYDMIFSFIYSPRPGTRAAEMAEQIPAHIASERFERMIALQNEICRERNDRFIGREMKLLVTEVSRTDENFLTARGAVSPSGAFCRRKRAYRRFRPSENRIGGYIFADGKAYIRIKTGRIASGFNKDTPANAVGEGLRSKK